MSLPPDLVPIGTPAFESRIPKSHERLRWTNRPVPENIAPVLTLLGATAKSYKIDGEEFWQIDKGMLYVRIQIAALLDDADAWRQVIGFLIDYEGGQIGPTLLQTKSWSDTIPPV